MADYHTFSIAILIAAAVALGVSVASLAYLIGGLLPGTAAEDERERWERMDKK